MLGGFGHWVVVLMVARSTPRFCDSLEGLGGQHIVVLIFAEHLVWLVYKKCL